jgi:cytochrome c-type biogenesis protein
MNMKRLFIGLFLIFICSASNVSADSKYTREKAEELFHLIQWHEYTLETFQKALDEQKPIYLVLSAPAWCYWCHVYESKDYLYHPDLYPYINEHFIAIFIDSDKRPDLTKKYMEGGWPSTTVLTPDLRRINGFSGPFDPEKLKDYLVRIIDFLKDKTFTAFNNELSYKSYNPVIPTQQQLEEMGDIFLDHIQSSFDMEHGGFIQGGSGQKFPTGLVNKYLLEKYEETGNADYLDMVKTTFDNQYTRMDDLESGYRLYDPVEGGFHRYSTKTDWSIPHYEKMLVDQAKMLRAYAHLLDITDDARVRSAVEGTISFVMNSFYDEDGGFYSTQDAYLEDKYYGLPKVERDELHPPYIDRTRVMDANSMIVSTFLHLYKTTGKREYRDSAKKSLDFLREKMTGENGAYYYFDHEKKNAFLTGQAVSNSWALLVFLDGYSVLSDKQYLHTAMELADYTLHNLYDWNSGGFFERNSVDYEDYAPYDQINLTKHYQENAVFSYSMLRLYMITNELKYLDTGLKTVGHLLSGRPGNLDDMYYSLKASEIIRANNLLNVYESNRGSIDDIVNEGRADFFLSEFLVEKEEAVFSEEPPQLTNEYAYTGFTVLAVLAFLAGLLSFLSPCTLPILPAYFAQGFNAGKGEILKNTCFFFLGLSIVFSIFGMGATYAGSILRENRQIFTQAAGVLIILMGTLEVFGKGFSGINVSLKGGHRNPVGSLMFGAVFAIGWSACIGPILASLLLVSATSGTVVKGTSLLFIYAAGLAVPLIIISLFFDRIKNNKFWKFLHGKGIPISIFNRKLDLHSTYVVSGLILVVLGVLVFNDYLYKLNQLTFQTDYVQDIIVKGEELLKGLFIN